MNLKDTIEIIPANNFNLHTVILLIILAISTVIIWNSFPKYEEYSPADEGTYYRQGTLIRQQGFVGFKEMGEQYVKELNDQGRPTPLRIAHILICATFLSLNDSLTSLSCYSLISTMLFCLALFFFVKKFWDINIALVVTIVAAFSPLTCGLARRALVDSTSYLISSLALFSFIYFLNFKEKKHYYWFIITLVLSILVKETNGIFMPFYVATLAFLRIIKKDNQITLNHIIGTIVCSTLIPLIIYFVAFADTNTVVGVLEATFKPQNIRSANYYSEYLAGPWYQYFIDYFIFSPIISILFFLFVGKYLLDTKKDINTNTLILFFIYFIFVFSSYAKNVRYAVNLNFIYILFAVLITIELISNFITNKSLQQKILIILTILITIFHVSRFNRFFLQEGIYDPIVFNLVKAEKMIPIINTSLAEVTNPIPAQESDNVKKLLLEINNNALDAMKDPSEGKYINLGLLYYKAKLYNEAINVWNKALGLNPKNSLAYNNICSAYNDLKEWDKAIEAGKKALEIDPNFQLAKSNISWAESQKAKSTKPN